MTPLWERLIFVAALGLHLGAAAWFSIHETGALL
jgi:hypothetical protein